MRLLFLFKCADGPQSLPTNLKWGMLFGGFNRLPSQEAVLTSGGGSFQTLERGGNLFYQAGIRIGGQMLR